MSRVTAAVWLSWLGLFLALELPAVHRRVPWLTLSEYSWSLEDAHPLLRWGFQIGLGILQSHIVDRWPA